MTEKNRQDFIHAYMTTALWAECRNDGTDREDEPLDDDFDVNDIDDETKADMESDCDKFLKDAEDILNAAIETGEVVCGPDFDEWGRAGHDFWLTRRGHGCGFWDGDWPEPFADQLTELSKKFSEEFNLYATEDGKVAKM